MLTDEMDDLTTSHVAPPIEDVQEAPIDAPAETPDYVESTPEPEPVQSGVVEEPEAANPIESRLAAAEEMINRLLTGRPLVDVPADQIPQQAITPQQYPAVPAIDPAIPVVDEDLFNEILSEPEKFNDFIKNIVQQTRQTAVQEAYGLAMQHLPSAILPTVHEAARNQMELRNWADSNPIVTQNPQIAAAILDQIDGSLPHLSVKEKLDMTLNHLNTYYGKPAQTPGTVPVTTPGIRPAFAQPPRGSVPRPAPVSALQAELDALD